MGWSSYHATYYKPNGTVDRKAEMDHLYTWEDDTHKVSVVRSRMVGSVYYAAVKVENDDEIEIIGAVALTCGQDRSDPYYNFGYKGMEETAGPYYYDCPKSILDLLTPTTNETALEWRKKCREKLTHKKVVIPRTANEIHGFAKSSTNGTNIGDKVTIKKDYGRWIMYNDTSGGRWGISLPTIRSIIDIIEVK